MQAITMYGMDAARTNQMILASSHQCKDERCFSQHPPFAALYIDNDVTDNPKASYSSSRIMKAIAEEGPRSHNPPDEPVMLTLIDRWNAFRELMQEHVTSRVSPRCR